MFTLLRERKRHGPLGRHAEIAEVVHDDLEQTALVTPLRGELEERLQQLLEERVAAEPTVVDVGIHLGKVSSLPEVHEPMHLVHKGNCAGSGQRLCDVEKDGLSCFLAASGSGDLRARVDPQPGPQSLAPGLQAERAATPFVRLILRAGIGVSLLVSDVHGVPSPVRTSTSKRSASSASERLHESA